MIQDPETAFDNIQLAFKVGDLDPVDEVCGQAGRLNNLGYFSGDVNQPDPDDFQSAVEEFQCSRDALQEVGRAVLRGLVGRP